MTASQNGTQVGNTDSNAAENPATPITHAVKIVADGRTREVVYTEMTVGDVLMRQEISIDSDDIVKPDVNTVITADMIIEVIRVEAKQIDEIVPILPKEVLKYDSKLGNDQQKVADPGTNGEKRVIATVTYENGKEVRRVVTQETIITPPKDKIIVRGTKPVIPMDKDGNPLEYSDCFEVKATAYWAFKGIGKTFTSTGRAAVWDPNGYSTIAVDPRLIPYGTQMYVEGYGFAIAADCGGGIKGKRIDVFYNTRKEARNWGVRHVKVYILGKKKAADN